MFKNFLKQIPKNFFDRLLLLDRDRQSHSRHRAPAPNIPPAVPSTSPPPTYRSNIGVHMRWVHMKKKAIKYFLDDHSSTLMGFVRERVANKFINKWTISMTWQWWCCCTRKKEYLARNLSSDEGFLWPQSTAICSKDYFHFLANRNNFLLPPCSRCRWMLSTDENISRVS